MSYDQELHNLQLAVDLYNYGLIEKSWQHLFIWGFHRTQNKLLRAYESTPKQKQQQKLFQQLGTLHRTRANLSNTAGDFKLSEAEHNYISWASAVIEKLISEVNHDMKMISSPQKDIV